MTLSQIEDVDVISNRSAVMGSIVVAVDHQLFPLACGNLCEKRKEVERYAERIFANDARRMSTSRVEVAKESSIPLLSVRIVAFLGCLCPLGVNVVCDHQLTGEFGVAIGVGGSQWAILWDGDHVFEPGGIAVDCSRGGVDNVGHVVVLSSAQQSQCAVNVDVVVLEWDLSGFADCLGRCQHEMRDSMVKTLTFRAAK